jgi:AraC-like DNA-binding protein
MIEKYSNHLSNFYQPLQPSSFQEPGVLYQEFAPPQGLENIVYCYWELWDQRNTEWPYTYKILADGCVDIYFNVKEPTDAQVMGFFHRYQSFDLPPGFHYAGIRFYPGSFHGHYYPQAFDHPGEEHPLRDVLPGLYAWVQSLATQHLNATQRWASLQLWLLENMHPEFPDHRVGHAIEEILKCSGNLNVEDGLRTGLSPRQLRRLFQKYVGDTPKMLARVVRFQMVLRAWYRKKTDASSAIFLDAGFYDQAHFTKEFKAFYGVTPGQIFSFPES